MTARRIEAPGSAEGASGVKAVWRLFRARRIEPRWFAPGPARDNLPGRLGSLLTQWKRLYGTLVDVNIDEGAILVRLEGATISAQLAMDSDGLIAGLFFRLPVPTVKTLEDSARAIIGLPGLTALLVTTGDEVRFAHRADAPMAVGSAFKLWVLQALALAVEEQDLAWDQVVMLKPQWRSLPSGILQAWPEGTPLTLMTLACLMIALSDNTATDALIDIVGRDRIDALIPASAPLLTTREAFILKAVGQKAERAAWLYADTDGRRALLASLADTPLPSVSDLSAGLAPEIEWMFTAWEIRKVLQATAALIPFRIDPGPADATRWERVAYKGGTEPRILNASMVLESHDGVRHTAVATWNSDQDIDPEELLAPLRALISTLEGSVEGACNGPGERGSQSMLGRSSGSDQAVSANPSPRVRKPKRSR